MPRNKYSRGRRNKIPIGQREFFPKEWPDESTRELGLRHIGNIRRLFGLTKKG